jgi:hypothetical protein
MSKIPQFTADLSLPQSGNTYRIAATYDGNSMSSVTPAAFKCVPLGRDWSHCTLVNGGFGGYFWDCPMLWGCYETWS